MIITKMKTTVVSIPYAEPIRFATRVMKKREYTILELETDEGLTSFGVVGFGVSLGASLILEEQLSRFVLGKDPLERERIWTEMYREVFRERRDVPIVALSAVDNALWDLFGKYVKLPIWKILGGFRKQVPCYASGGYYKESKDVSGLVKEIDSYISMGFNAFKIKVGATTLKGDIERVRAVRKTIGDEGILMVDANNSYDSTSAIKAGREYEKFGIYWFEEPVWPDDLDGSARVASSLDVPLAAGELEYLRYGFYDMVTRKAVDIIQPDPTICGGITEWIKIAGFAAAHSVPVAPHDAQETNVHVGAASPQVLMLEFFPREEMIRLEDLLFETYNVPKNGLLDAPNASGLGVELDRKAISKYKIHEKTLTVSDM
jgi:D-arabinonate dehydratase